MRRALALVWMCACQNGNVAAMQSTVLPPDAAPLPDLAEAKRDMAVPLDLAVPDPPDLAVPIDMTQVDLATLRTVDLATPDLARNPAGPWPVTDVVVYALSDIIDASPDDGQNIWAASPDTLYQLKPGASSWVKFTAADGLHIQPFIDPDGNPSVTAITGIAGGAANQVFVGYHGYEDDDRYNDTLAVRVLGQADKVTLGSDGKIADLHYLFRCDGDQGTGNGCWEDRSVRRMLYVHSGTAAGHLFIGFDHGVTHVVNDVFGDHIHVETWYHYPDGHVTEKIGEQYGLFAMPSGDLWTASAYGVGLQTWSPDSKAWVHNNFKEAFTLYTSDHTLDTADGYREDNRGVGVTPDGNVWFASKTHGLASWDSSTPHNYTNVKTWSAPPLLDLAADSDGTLWLVSIDGQLLRFDPKANGYSVFPGLDGVRRIVMDTTVTPRALYVSMSSGVAVIRAK
jgi:hypothetical protein